MAPAATLSVETAAIAEPVGRGREELKDGAVVEGTGQPLSNLVWMRA
jgi:hypothetical protein